MRLSDWAASLDCSSQRTILAHSESVSRALNEKRNVREATEVYGCVYGLGIDRGRYTEHRQPSCIKVWCQACQFAQFPPHRLFGKSPAWVRQQEYGGLADMKNAQVLDKGTNMTRSICALRTYLVVRKKPPQMTGAAQSRSWSAC